MLSSDWLLHFLTEKNLISPVIDYFSSFKNGIYIYKPIVIKEFSYFVDQFSPIDNHESKEKCIRLLKISKSMQNGAGFSKMVFSLRSSVFPSVSKQQALGS